MCSKRSCLSLSFWLMKYVCTHKQARTHQTHRNNDANNVRHTTNDIRDNCFGNDANEHRTGTVYAPLGISVGTELRAPLLAVVKLLALREPKSENSQLPPSAACVQSVGSVCCAAGAVQLLLLWVICACVRARIRCSVASPCAVGK